MKKILVVGSINIDQVLKIKNFPKTGETIYSSSKHIYLGGKGCNQAIALQKLKNSVTFIGKVGCDQDAAFALEQLQKYRLSTDNVIKTKASTGIASIYVSQNGENTIVLMPGANHLFVNENTDF